MSDSKTPPALDPVQAAFDEVERQVSQKSPVCGVVSRLRTSVHSLRSALTPLASGLQFVLDEELLSKEGRAAVVDGQTALTHALLGLDALVTSVQSQQPLFALSEALPPAAWGTFPECAVQGASDYLSAAVEALARDMGEGLRRSVEVDLGTAVIELSGGNPLNPTGVPLTLARRLLGRIGGDVEVRDVTVKLHVPVRAVLAPQAVPAPKRILLIVDDEPDLAPMFRRFLRRDFDEILDALDAPRAEELLQRPITHLVVDAGLPEVSGVELVSRWRAQTPTVRFTAMFSGSTDLRGAAIPGVDEVYLKPDGFEDLLAELKKR